jgi:hypothetical protein
MLATILPPQRDISEEKAKFINKNQNKTESNASIPHSQAKYSQLETAEQCGILACNAVQIGELTFRKNILPPTSG